MQMIRRYFHAPSQSTDSADSFAVLQLCIDTASHDRRPCPPAASPQITDTTIAELGPGGLSVTGVGFVTINHTVFSYLATGALDISARGGISVLNSRVSAAAPAPLWRVRGGNGTRLENVTFLQPPSPSLVLLDRPTGDETLAELRFGCRGERRLQAGWTAAAAAGPSTVSEGLRRYLQLAEAAAECSPAPPQTAASSRQSAGSSSGGGSGGGLFSDPAQVGLEMVILLAAAAVGTLAVAAVVVGRRRRRQRGTQTDTQVLVEAEEVSEG